jgi:gliding motility-associated-like protein
VVSTTGTPVDYTFNNPGSFYTSLIITDSKGCVDTSYNVIIEAGSKLSPDFSVSKYSTCYGDTIKLNGSPDSIGSNFKWRYSSSGIFNSGFMSSPDVDIILKPEENGNKSIKLEVENHGCISSVIKNNIYSVKGPLGNFVKSLDCSDPLKYTFISNIKPATSLKWTIDTFKVNNEDTVTYSFPLKGTYTVSLLAEDLASGCKLTRNSFIKVRKVSADFKVNSFYCLGDSTIFLGESSKDYISKCYYEGFLWDFNDNTPPRRTSSSAFGHIYFNKQTYNPLLTVTGDNGCIDTLRKTLQVLRPEPFYTTDHDSGCAPSMKVVFTNASTDPTIDNWTWFLGDGAIDAASPNTINHTYIGENSEFNPRLRVIDSHGCYAEYSKPIIMTNPDARFQAFDNAICLGEEVIFQKADTNPDKFIWTFGDNTGSQTSDNHFYSKTGTYDVKLTVSKNGCIDSSSRKAYISVEKADASFSVDDSVADCYPQRINFTHNDSNSYPQRIWSFGTGTVPNDNDENVRFTYTKPGKYNSSLLVKSLNGCIDKKSKLITINGPSAYFSFSPRTICYGDSVVFRIDSLKEVDKYIWYYADGDTGQSIDTVHYYRARGILTPTVKLENKKCTTTLNAGVVNISRLKAAFDFKDKKNVFCESIPISTINRSTYNNKSTWKLDNTVLSTERSLVDYRMNTTGNLRLKLEVGDNNNCVDTISKALNIIKSPEFNIVGKTVICRDIDTALLTINPENTWYIRWSPENGINNPTSFRVYASPDTTTTYVALVTDTAGCMGFDIIQIAVNQPYSLISFPEKDTSINIGEPAYITVLSSKENVSYWWSPDYKISCRTCNNPVVVPYKDYTYKVKVKDDCFEREKEIKIKVIKNFYLEAPEAFSPNNDGHNDVFYFENENIKTFNLKVFNRWGNIVFETDNINSGWDGTSNGKKQNIDTYSYIVKAETISGYKFEKKGTVILLK